MINEAPHSKFLSIECQGKTFVRPQCVNQKEAAKLPFI